MGVRCRALGRGCKVYSIRVWVLGVGHRGVGVRCTVGNWGVRVGYRCVRVGHHCVGVGHRASECGCRASECGCKV